MTFRLTRQAERDVIEIYRYSAAAFGLVQADSYHDKLDQAFRLLADQPYMARERTEIAPPVRVHRCGFHVIIYLVMPDESVMIVRVRHSREDWLADPAGPAD